MNALRDHNYVLHPQDRTHYKTRPLTQDLYNCTISPEKYKCRYCGFQTNLLVLAHKKICPRANYTDSSVKIPLLKSYSCKKCNFQTSSYLIYMRHINMKCLLEVNCTVFKCDQCDFHTRYNQSLVQHKVAVHQKITKKYNYNEEHNYCKENVQQVCNSETNNLAEEHNGLYEESFPKRRGRVLSTAMNKSTNNKSSPTVLQSLQCDGCSFIATSQRELADHIYVNRPLNITYKCKNCIYETKNITIFKYHVITKHRTGNEPATYECQHCQFKTLEVFILKCHILNQHPKPEYSLMACEYCSFTARNFYILKKHVNTCHVFKCPNCTSISASKAALTKHIWTFHKVNWCKFCFFTTRDGNELVKHEKSHHSIKCFYCDLAVTEMSLSEHLATVHQVFKCVYCPFNSKDEGKMDKHMEQFHVKCPHCMYVANKVSLKVHILTNHEKDVNYMVKCSQCSYKCESWKELNNHFLTNHNHKVKWYKCESERCSYKDTVKDRIEKHIMKEHTNAEEAYQCKVCSFKTGKEIDLDTHYFQAHPV